MTDHQSFLRCGCTSLMKNGLSVGLLLMLAIHPASAKSFLMGTSDDCISAAGSVFESSLPQVELPRDRAVVRVGYWGDPGTPERSSAVSNQVNWNVGLVTGILASPNQQRGFADRGLPIASSAVQARCTEAGVQLNTYQFSHTAPVFGGGPQMSFGEKRNFPIPIFRASNQTADKLIIQASIKHPQHHWDEAGAVGQIALVYYLQPLNCPELFPNQACPAASLGNRVPAFAHVIGVYDSRPADPSSGVGLEHMLHDGFNAFFSSPLANLQANGDPVRFLTPHLSSALARNQHALWSEYRFFRADISHVQLQKMLNIFRDSAAQCAQFSVDDPACLVRASSADIRDWGIVLVAGLVEAFPQSLPGCVRGANPAGCQNISMGVGLKAIDAYAGYPEAMGREGGR